MGPGIKSHPVFLVKITIDPETLYQGENRETQIKRGGNNNYARDGILGFKCNSQTANYCRILK